MSPTLLRDATGRFVADRLVALWATTCDICGERRDDHVGQRPATGKPWCPVVVTDNRLVTVTRQEALTALIEGRLDGTSFDPCDVTGCIAPTAHEVGCDCYFGICS